jgi:phage-related protein (TIGR01555 family)
VLEARTKARLWGGAAILIGTGDVDPSQPLNPEKVKAGGVQYLTVVTRRELTSGEIDTDPASEFYGKPASYTLNSQNAQPVMVHPSRLVIFQGAQVPDEDLNINRGWGDSVLTSILDAVKNADSTAANVASLVFEAKVDVIRVPNFMASLSDPEYERRILQRYALANAGKGVNGTLMLDKDEEYQSKSASFATLPDIIDRFLQIVAGAADIPLTRLLGTSPGGLNSTGESDLRNYYDRISAMQQIEMQPAMFRMDEAIIRSALGSRPPEVHYIWSSLWLISDKERADIGKINAETIKSLNDTGLFPPEALANAGANMLVENSILPGFDQAIEDAGGLPDYEMEAEQEAEQERLRLEAAANTDPANQ